MSKRVQISLSLALVIGGMLLRPGILAWGVHEQIITARHVRKAPIGLDDTVWQNARMTQILFGVKEGITGNHTKVNTKVVYTDDSLYFRFKWDDPTRSVLFKAWKFDGKKWSHSKGLAYLLMVFQ